MEDVALPPCEMAVRAAIADRLARGELDGETLQLTRQLIEASPDHAYAHVVASRCLEGQGAFDKAAHHLDHVLRVDPGHSVARNRRAALEHKLEHQNRARRLFSAGPGQLKDALDRARAAERDFDFQVEGRRLLARHEKTPPSACAFGAALRHRGNPDDLETALVAYDYAIKLDPSRASNAPSYVGRAAVLRDLRRLTESEQLYREVLVTNPDDKHAIAGLAAVLLDRYETERDAALLDAADTLVKQLPPTAFGRLYGRLRRLREAP